jgi:hypothetical protein
MDSTTGTILLLQIFGLIGMIWFAIWLIWEEWKESHKVRRKGGYSYKT